MSGQNGSHNGLVIDCDVHPEPARFPVDDALASCLPKRWLDYLETYGPRSVGGSASQIPPHRAVGEGAVARLDSVPPSGAEPGSDPDFAREQLLDAHDIRAAILNSFGGLGMLAGNVPSELEVEWARACNDWLANFWLASDPRWYASICVPYEQPDKAALEIARCCELSDRFVQVLLPSRSVHPIGNPKYWPIFEAAEHYGLPVGFHVGYCRAHQDTACGIPKFYFQYHVGFAEQPLSVVPSLIFEGVFDRFPKTRVAMVELGWSWAVALAWRLDASWRVLGGEVEHLERKPSEYFTEHVWFTTQPMIEPPGRGFAAMFEQFERAGWHDKLLFSSDYPHWDGDVPADTFLRSLPRNGRAGVLGRNAAALYAFGSLGEETAG